MIGYIRGTIAEVMCDCCFIDVNGLGYRVFIPLSTRSKLTVGEVITLYTYLNVRDDLLQLYGFVTQEEYDLFTRLITVSGIGPKVALGILSTLSPREFSRAIREKNVATLTQVPGIGKKTAERMVLELKDKLGDAITGEEGKEIAAVSPKVTGIQQEALQALMALGYCEAEVLPVLHRLAGDNQSVEGLIRAVLKEFAGGSNGGKAYR